MDKFSMNNTFASLATSSDFPILEHTHVEHENLVCGRNMNGGPLIIADSNSNPGLLGWHTSTLPTEL